MYTSEGTKMRSIENQLAEQQKQSWLMLVAGISVGFVGLHFLMARPMSREIERIHQNMAQVEQRMQDLVGARDEVWEANSLLSSLKAQQGQIVEARGALQSIRELRSDLIEEAVRNPQATASLESAARLQSQIIDQKPIVDAAEVSFERMASLQDQLKAEIESNKAASGALSEMIAIKNEIRLQADDLEQTKKTLGELVQLAEQLRQQTDGLAPANRSLEGLATLKAGLTKAGENLEAAQAVSDQLVSLEQRLVDGGQMAVTATERAEQLIALNKKLDGTIDLAKSQQNLDGLLDIQQHLLVDSKSVADAIQSLEVLTGFQEEFVSQIQVLGEMHRNLVEISMMENTLSKVSRMMQPLAELGNLRRLGDDELRQAARLILDGRTATRLSKNAPDSRPYPIDSTSGKSLDTAPLLENTGLVPTPDDLE